MNLNLENIVSLKDYLANPKYCQPLDDGDMQLLAMCLAVEMSTDFEMRKEFGEKLAPFFIVKVINKRIEAFELRITLTDAAKGAIASISGSNPGRAIFMLIEILNNTFNEDEPWTADMVCKLFPNGLFKEEVFCQVVDELLKTKKYSNSHIY